MAFSYLDTVALIRSFETTPQNTAKQQLTPGVIVSRVCRVSLATTTCEYLSPIGLVRGVYVVEMLNQLQIQL